MPGDDDPLLLRGPTADNLVVLTLNRPDKRNALSIALRDAMSDTLDVLAVDEDIKAAIITGAGPAFCAGFDLSEFDALDDAAHARRLWASSDRWHRTVLSFPLPLIAAVNGPALAGGFDLAIMCDIRVASPSARFAHPEQTFSDVVYGPLHDAVGGAVARDLAMTGRPVDAEEALRVRLVSAVADDVMGEAYRLAALVTRGPREVLMRTKAKAVRRAAVAGQTLDL